MKVGGNITREKKYDPIKQKRRFFYRVEELGKQLGLSTNEIRPILNNTKHITDHLSFSLGPPNYGAGFYGTVSIGDFEL